MKFDKINSYKNVFEKKLFYRFLLNASKPTVWALINEKHRKIYIQGSSSPLEAIGRFINELSHKTSGIKEMKRDREYLRLLILEQFDVSKYLKIDKTKWLDHYKDLGFSIYNIENLPKYTVHSGLNYKHNVAVYVRSGGRRTQLIKVFHSYDQAKDFIATTNLYDMLKSVK